MIETDVWVVTVHIIQPYLVMHYKTRLHTTDLTDASIYGYPLLDKRPPSSLPCFALVKLFLGQHISGPFAVVVAVPELHWCRGLYTEPLLTG